jgi:hypothetical protein
MLSFVCGNRNQRTAADHTANLCVERWSPDVCVQYAVGFLAMREIRPITTCKFQSGVSGVKEKRGMMRTSNTTALICCICVVNGQLAPVRNV